MLRPMTTRSTSPIACWRETFCPLFWPVFFWNLRKFANFLRQRIETGGNRLIDYELTWWGGIGIYEMFDPDAPA